MERAKGGAAPDPGWQHTEPVLGPDWIVLIVDDDQDIHAAIRLAVGRGRFFGRNCPQDANPERMEKPRQ